jgi:hypothetical protein
VEGGSNRNARMVHGFRGLEEHAPFRHAVIRWRNSAMPTMCPDQRSRSGFGLKGSQRRPQEYPTSLDWTRRSCPGRTSGNLHRRPALQIYVVQPTTGFPSSELPKWKKKKKKKKFEN